MSRSPTRYGLSMDGYIEPDENGDYVRLSDYDILLVAKEAAEAKAADGWTHPNEVRQELERTKAALAAAEARADGFENDLIERDDWDA